MSYLTDRRRFLKSTALTGVGVFVAGTAAADDSKSPNERIRFACIGVGGKGSSDSGDAKQHGDVVAICDIDDNTLEKASSKSFPNAAKYNDFRKMLDEVGKNIDAVTVSTPDHMHGPATALAMRMGKGCYTQKPLTRTIQEARRLGEIAREMKVATQMGNQGTATPSLRKTAAVVRAGAVGNIKEVHVWTNRPIWPQGPASGRGQRAAERALGLVARPRAAAALMRRDIILSPGAAGGILAAARWATWRAIPSTCRSWRSIFAIRPPCKPRPPATTKTATRNGRSSSTTFRPTPSAPRW